MPAPSGPYLTGIDWGSALPSLSVNYTFVPASPVHSTPWGDVETFELSDYETAQIERALAEVSTFTNLAFYRVASEADAQIFFMTSGEEDMGTSILGAGSPPGEDGAGTILFNRDGRGWAETTPGTGALEQGGYAFVTIIHEIGHALGLAHPHDNGGTSTIFPGVSGPSDYGTDDLNQGVFTTMSYNDGWDTSPSGFPPSGTPYGFQGTYMALDIAVLQAKYGANPTTGMGNDVYALKDGNGVGTYYACIWDVGGEDTIAYSGARNATIDLRAATLTIGPGTAGWVSFADGVYGGFTIAHGVVIENATGGNADDVLTGNAAANILDGGAGADRMAAGAGNDTYRVDDRRDVVDEEDGDGTDIVYASVNFNLSDSDQALGFVENLTLTGTGDVDATGNALANLLIGNDADNVLAGRDGQDDLYGMGGADLFVFNTPIFRTPGNRDTVHDFSAADDMFALESAIFTKIGRAGILKSKYFHRGGEAHDSSDRLIYSNKKDVLVYDKNGDDHGGAKIVAVILGDVDLTARDFLVI